MINQAEVTDQEHAIRMARGMARNLELSEMVVSSLRARGLYVTTVESCTSGALASCLTDTPGASEVLKDAFVTYCNEAKIALGVPAEIIDRHTVYSLETALAMVEAGLKRSVRADVGVGITGSISRSDPQNRNSTPGTIYLAVKYGCKATCKQLTLSAPRRTEVKQLIVEEALRMILWSMTELRRTK